MSTTRRRFLQRAAGAAAFGYVMLRDDAIERVRAEAIRPVPASLIQNGKIPGYDFYGIVNERVPDGARVLLVGEARAFYFGRSVDYHIVFNRNPFAEVVRGADDVGEIIRWLRESGYDYVLVNWSEVERLSATYGFAPEINPVLNMTLYLTAWAAAGNRNSDKPTVAMDRTEARTVRGDNISIASKMCLRRCRYIMRTGRPVCMNHTN